MAEQHNPLVAMLAALAEEQGQTEEQIRTLTAHVEELKTRRTEVERLASWKPGDPLPWGRTEAPPPPVVAPLPPASTEEATWLEAMRQKHGADFVRSEQLKKEFPQINFAVLFGKKLITARGTGRGREYKIR